MVTRRRFTKEEDLVIFSKISENPWNIKKCFQELSGELERSEASVRNRWYGTISRRNADNSTNVAFMTYGKKGAGINKKNILKPKKIKQSKWRRILDIIFE